MIKQTWALIMDSEKNPLRHIPDINTRHMVMQVLAWMWCIIFSTVSYTHLRAHETPEHLVCRLVFPLANQDFLGIFLFLFSSYSLSHIQLIK